MDYARKIAFNHNGPQHSTQLKSIDRFGDKNRVNSNNFNATILKLSGKFDRPFFIVFMFGNIFPESDEFVGMPVTSCINDTGSNLSLSN